MVSPFRAAARFDSLAAAWHPALRRAAAGALVGWGPVAPALPLGGAPTPRPGAPARFARALRATGRAVTAIGRTFFVGYARPRQQRPACKAGTQGAGMGTSLMWAPGRRAGRRSGTGANRAASQAAGLYVQNRAPRGLGESAGAGLSAPRRAGWRRAKPAVARFLRAPLFQLAPRYARSPF